MSTQQVTAPVDAGAAADYAARAAVRAGVTVGTARDNADLARVSGLALAVWGPAKPLPLDILQAVTLAGGTILLATHEGEPVGFTFGFLGWTPVAHVHSHMAAVLPGWRGRGVGLALKLAQRAACLAHGVRQVRWTFDPLVRANAAFNLVRLGVTAPRFLPDFYGQMRDTINGTDVSDRLEVAWHLDRPVGARPASGDGPALLDVDPAGVPHRNDTPAAAGTVLPIPDDYLTLRSGGDPRARQWRQVTGAVLTEAYQRGLAVESLTANGYLLEERRTR